MSVDAKVQIGLSTDFLEGVGVDTPAGMNLFREGVVISDPDVSGARAKITNAAPATDAYGLAVRVIGGVVVGSEVEIKNDSGNPIPVAGSVSVSNFPATQPVSGTVALDSASLAALETIQVGNFPATQVVSATDLDIRNLSSAQDSVTVTGSVNSTVSGTVEITNDVGNPIPVSGTVAVTDGGGSITVDGTVAVSNHPASQSVVGSGAAATAQRVQLADESLAALESITATVSGTVSVGNTVAVSATDLDIRNLSSAQDSVAITDGGGSITVDGSVSVSGTVAVNNFPATQAVSGTVALDTASLAALETIQVGNFPATQAVSGTVTVTQATAANLNATVTGSVNVGNFPATQAVSGTVTANAGTGTFAISAVSLPLPTGAASASNQTTTNTTLSSLDNKTPDESGAWGYNAGTNGSLAVAANKRIIAITATASPLTAASMTINAGQTITIPAGTSITITPRANLTAPTLVFTSTASYFVEFVE